MLSFYRAPLLNLAVILHQFFKGFLNLPKSIYCPLCSASRCSATRKPPAEHVPAKLMAHSLMAPTSALLLLKPCSLMSSGPVQGEEEQCKLRAIMLLFLVILCPVQQMIQSVSTGLRRESADSHSRTTDVSPAIVVVQRVAMRHNKGQTVTPITNITVMGNALLQLYW